MNDDYTPSEPDARRYRIGVADLLAWITGASFAMVAIRWMFYAKNPPEAWLEAKETKVLILYAYQTIFIGAQLASGYALVRSLRLGLSFPQAPGHLILLLAGINFLANVAQFGIVKMLNPALDVKPDDWLLFFYSGPFAHLISGCLAVFAAIALRKLRLWQLYFVFNAVELCLLFLFDYRPFLATRWPDVFSDFAASLDFVPEFLLYAFWFRFTLTIVCIVADMNAGRKWDILHYVGITSIWAISFGAMTFNRFA